MKQNRCLSKAVFNFASPDLITFAVNNHDQEGLQPNLEKNFYYLEDKPLVNKTLPTPSVHQITTYLFSLKICLWYSYLYSNSKCWLWNFFAR